jgi:Ran-binding protein 3
LKINVRYEASSASQMNEDGDDESDLEGGITSMERRGRVLMRMDGVHRVILNTPVFKEMKVGTQDGGEPSGKTMYLSGLEEGKPKGFSIRVSCDDVSC